MLFSNVIGYEPQKKLLRRMSQTGIISRVIMFCGVKGQGRSLIIKDLARRILTENTADSAYSATLFDSGKHPDFFAVNETGPIKIDLIRQAIGFLGVNPSIAKHRVIYVSGAEAMTVESVNAFLKTLEEPPEHSIIFLSVEHLHELPETVISRCMRIILPPLNETEQIAAARQRFPDIDPDYCRKLLRVTDGRINKDLFETTSRHDLEALFDFCSGFVAHPESRFREGVLGYFDKMVTLNTSSVVFRLMAATFTERLRVLPHGQHTLFNTYLRALETVTEYQKSWEANANKPLCLLGMFAALKHILT